MTDSRELTPQAWDGIQHAAHDLFELIHSRMDDLELPDGQLPPEWHELHDLLRLAHVISGQAARYRDRARDRAELERQTAPVPYLPARLTEAELRAEITAELRRARSELSAAPPAPLAAEGVYKLRGTAELDWDF